jgi:hypothetical protein
MMKIKNYWVILTGSAVVLTSSGRGLAQSQLSSDGYAVTPKLRQTAENGGVAAPGMGGGEMITGEGRSANVFVTPAPAIFPPTYYESQAIGYKTTWDDGIAASPRFRQIIRENKYDMPPMGGSQFIGDESTGGRAAVNPQSQRVWVESHPGTVGSPMYDRSVRVGYARSFDYGIAAPPRAWKTMLENSANGEMFALR